MANLDDTKYIKAFELAGLKDGQPPYVVQYDHRDLTWMPGGACDPDGVSIQWADEQAGALSSARHRLQVYEWASP